MSGKQLHVYLLPSDAVALVEELRHRIGLQVFARRFIGPTPGEVKSPLIVESGFTRADCLFAPVPSAVVNVESSLNEAMLAVDLLTSEVIQFNGCYFDGSTIKRGRLYYQTGYYEDGIWKEKSQRFLDFGSQVWRITKKFLKRSVQLDSYVGRDASSWREQGGTFIELEIRGHAPILAGAHEREP